MKILSTLGVKGVLDRLVPEYARQTGIAFDIACNPTVVQMQAIEAGARADMALLTAAGIDELIAKGVLRAGSAVPLARSKVGLAVPQGAPRPSIATRDDVVRALCAAEHVVYSGSGASGIYFSGLLKRLGIADAVNERAVIIPKGFTAELLRDGRATLAVQQVSELMSVAGVDVLGPLPDEIQDDLVFTGGIFAEAADPEAAMAFLRHISGPGRAALYREMGLFDI
ncbi:MAG: substrate-binding domain-containing protein [Hyphomicrobiaceae bacterium]